MRNILIIAQPLFVDGLKEITSNNNLFNINVISRNDKRWAELSFVQKMILLQKYDIIHFFGAKTTLFHFLLYKFIAKTIVVNHFIGTDLYRVLRKNFLKKIKLFLCSKVTITIAISPLLKSELLNLNINNKILYFLNYNIKRRTYTFPVEMNAITYINSNNRDFFNYQYLLKLAIDFPEVKFTWCPYKKVSDEFLPKNIKCVEWIEQDKFINELEKNKVFIRLPKHDGFPNTICEALNLGRYTIWSFDYIEHTHICNSYEEFKKIFSVLINKSEPNTAGENYIVSEFNYKKIQKNFKDFYKKIFGDDYES